MNSKTRVAYLVAEPIVYQVPLLRMLAKHPEISLCVFFLRNTAKGHYSKHFQRKVTWDRPLLGDYNHIFITNSVNNTAGLALKYRVIRLLCQNIKRSHYDIVWIHGYSQWWQLLAIFIAKLRGIKVIIRGESVYGFTETSLLKKLIRPLFMRMLVRSIDIALTIGSCNRQFYQHYGVENSKLLLAPYTVDNDFFQQQIQQQQAQIAKQKASLHIPNDAFVILCVSTLLSRKRVIDLVQAIQQIDNDSSVINKPHLLLIGEGEEKANLIHFIKKNKLDNVKLLGFMNQTQLPLYYALADIFVLPSERENWGLVINEAMNASCAIVASDNVSAVYDLVIPDENGYIYPVGDVLCLAQALKKLCCNRTLCDRFGKKSKDIINQWGIQQTANGIVNACEVLSGATLKKSTANSEQTKRNDNLCNQR